MTAQRRFPGPWQSVPIPGGYVVIDNEGKRLAYVFAKPQALEEASFDRLTEDEAMVVAGTIARVPDLLTMEAAGPRIKDPELFLIQEGGAFVILREANGVLQRSRQFETPESAVYACVVWYGRQPRNMVPPPAAEPVTEPTPAAPAEPIASAPAPAAEQTPPPADPVPPAPSEPQESAPAPAGETPPADNPPADGPENAGNPSPSAEG